MRVSDVKKKKKKKKEAKVPFLQRMITGPKS
jgi:hypothetical protein